MAYHDHRRRVCVGVIPVVEWTPSLSPRRYVRLQKTAFWGHCGRPCRISLGFAAVPDAAGGDLTLTSRRHRCPVKFYCRFQEPLDMTNAPSAARYVRGG